MIFIHDTRDKKNKHQNVELYIEGLGHRIVRSKMFVGDIALLNDQSVCIDLKASLTEVESNLIQQHDRFRREAQRAQENGIRLIILVEAHGIHSLEDVAGWENPRRKRWEKIDQAHANGRMLSIQISPKPPVDGAQLMQIMKTMQAKYGLEWRFCSHQDAGKEILKYLGVESNAPGSGSDQTGDPHADVPSKRWRAC